MSEHREDVLQVEVPGERVDIDEAPYADDAGNMIVDVRASTSLSAFQSGWDTPTKRLRGRQCRPRSRFAGCFGRMSIRQLG